MVTEIGRVNCYFNSLGISMKSREVFWMSLFSVWRFDEKGSEGRQPVSIKFLLTDRIRVSGVGEPWSVDRFA